jgi:hypothetical protein
LNKFRYFRLNHDHLQAEINTVTFHIDDVAASSGLGLAFGLGKDGGKGLRPIYTTQRLPKAVARNQVQPTYNLSCTG